MVDFVGCVNSLALYGQSCSTICLRRRTRTAIMAAVRLSSLVASSCRRSVPIGSVGGDAGPADR